MPACTDCGQLFDSPYYLQQHRPNCPLRNGAANYNGYVGATNGAANPHGTLPAIHKSAASGNNPSMREIDQMLALQQAQQQEEMTRREKMLLEQQVNLVLPARQAELQQTQEQLKNQVMQLKLSLLNQQQFGGQQNSMELEMLRNELAAVRSQLNASTPPPPPAAGGFGGYNPYTGSPVPVPGYSNSWPVNPQRQQQPQDPQPAAYQPSKPKTSKKNNKKNGRRGKERQRSRRARSRRNRSRDFESDDDDDYSSSQSDISDRESDYSDEYDDDEDRSSGYGDYDDDDDSNRRYGRGGNRLKRATRRTQSSPPRSRSKRSAPRSAPAGQRPSENDFFPKKNIYDFLSKTPTQQQDDGNSEVMSILQSMRQEIDQLRTQNNPENSTQVPFPVTSSLHAGACNLKLSSLEGLDMTFPLEDVEVNTKTYHLYFQNGEYVLDPRGEKFFPRNTPSLARAGSNLCVFTVPHIDFTLTENYQMFVFLVQICYRGTPLYWATVFTRGTGPWTEGIRRAPVDIARALQSSDDMVKGAVLKGTLEYDGADILEQAERLLMSMNHGNTNNGSNIAIASPGGRLPSTVGSTAAVPEALSPDSASTSKSVTPGKTATPQKMRNQIESPEASDEEEEPQTKKKEPEKPPAPKPLPGLPPLPPPPEGLWVLPGMPGNEGPFLPPKASDVFLPFTADQMPTKEQMPIPRFRLPPPKNVSLLEWKERLDRRIVLVEKWKKKVDAMNLERRADPPAPAPAADNKANKGKNNNNNKNSVSDNSRRKSDEKENEVSFRNDDDENNRNIMENSGSIVESDTDLPPPKKNGKKQPRVNVFSPGKGGDDGLPPALVSHEESEAKEKEKEEKERKEKEEKERKEKEEKERKEKEEKERKEKEEREREEKERKEREERERAAAAAAAAASARTPKKVPRDPSIAERGKLLPVTDKQGNLAVPPQYKNNPNNPAAIGLEKFDVPTNGVNAATVVGLADPKDAIPPRHPPGHGPNKDDVNMFVDGVVGVPMDSLCCRVAVYIVDGTSPSNKINIHHPRVFMRKPDLLVYQALDSSCMEPEFTGMLKTKMGPNTHAVCVVEYIVERQEEPVCLGHCCVAVNKKAFAGNFMTRLKLGDPRRTQERDMEDGRPVDRLEMEQKRLTGNYGQSELELSVNSQSLRNMMPQPPRKRAECVPMSYLVWRLDSASPDEPYQETPGQLPISQAELQLYNARVPAKDSNPVGRGIKTLKLASDEFIGPSTPLGDGISYIAPYVPDRGVFLRVAGMRGLGNDCAIYTVVFRIHGPSYGHSPHFPSMPDWFSDVGAPFYKDPPTIFANLPYDPLKVFIFTLLKITDIHTEPKTEAIGWTINKIFLDDPNTVRQGNFLLPWLKGTPSAETLKRLETEKLDRVYIDELKKKTLTFLEPPASLIISQGVPLIIPQLVDTTPGSPEPRPLLIPSNVKKMYPTSTCEGQIGCTLKTQNEECFGRIEPQNVLPRISREAEKYIDSLNLPKAAPVENYKEL